jgi:hypothetical protein
MTGMNAKVLPLRSEQGRSSCSTTDGATAAVLRTEHGDERLEVRDGRSRLLFEYVPDGARCVVHLPAGDLLLRADEGAIELDAAKGIRLRGGPLLDLEADTLRTSADEAEVTLARALVRVDVLESVYRRLRQKVDIMETRAGRIVERAQESYRDVQTLAQTRAGRIRLVAEKTFHVLGTRALLKAHEDVKIKGDKIHLG